LQEEGFGTDWGQRDRRQLRDECFEVDKAMRIHNQVNPNYELNALSAAAKAEAKKEAERTRKKLFDSASALAGEYDEAVVVKLSGDRESKEDSQQHTAQDQGGEKEQANSKAPQDDDTFSGWA